MYKSYCAHCDNNWENSSPNCPHCGTPNPSAERIGGAKNKKKQTMNETESTFAKAAADAMKQGALQAAAKESNELLKAGVAKALVAAGVDPDSLDNPVFNKGVPLASACVLLFLAERFPDAIPKAEYVAKAAKMALTQATTDTIEPMIAAAAPTLLQLASAGEKAKELEGDLYDDEDDDDGDYDPEGEYHDAEYSEREEVDVTPVDDEVKRPGPRGVKPNQARRSG